MSAAADHIAALDKALADEGDDLILRRVVSSVNVDLPVRGSVRTGAAAVELVGTIAQGQAVVTISPTEIMAANWPAGTAPTLTAFTPDPRVPKIGDKVIAQGKLRTVAAVQPTINDGTLVRLDLTVDG